MPLDLKDEYTRNAQEIFRKRMQQWLEDLDALITEWGAASPPSEECRRQAENWLKDDDDA